MLFNHDNNDDDDIDMKNMVHQKKEKKMLSRCTLISIIIFYGSIFDQCSFKRVIHANFSIKRPHTHTHTHVSHQLHKDSLFHSCCFLFVCVPLYAKLVPETEYYSKMED